MKFNFNNSIFLRIGIVAISICLFLIILLFSYLTYRVSSNENETKSVIASLASQNVLDKIERNFYERFGDVQAFSYNILAKNALKGDSVAKTELQEYINTMVTYYVLYDIAMLCDVKGNVVAINTKDKFGNTINSKVLYNKSVAGEEWFKACLFYSDSLGGAWFSKFQINDDVGRIYNSKGLGVGFAAPVRDKMGNIIGVWYNYTNWQEITQNIRKADEYDLHKNNPNSFIVITRNTGEIIDAENPDWISDKYKINYDITSQSDLNLAGSKIEPDNYIIRSATAKGAYTYKGRKWKAFTFIPKTKFSIFSFFSIGQIPLYIVILSLIAVFSFIIYKMIQISITSKLYKLIEIMDRQSMGEIIKIPNDLKTQDEIGKIANALDKAATNFKDKAYFADEIGKGKFQTEFTVKSEKDILGISLINMRNNLMKVKKEEEERNWSSEGLALFADIIRKNVHNEATLADKLLSELIKYVYANQGALYIEEDGKLNMISCYAWGRKKFISNTIEIQEGLIGQAYLEKETIFLTDIPADFTKIKSGLGEASPKCLLITPLKLDEEVLGIIEIALFTIIPSYKVTFIEKVGEIVASFFKNIKINNQNRKLNEESQLIEEQMRAQEKEMRRNMEELRTTQEEMGRREKDLQNEIDFYKNDRH